jgi:hypothetical protein
MRSLRQLAQVADRLASQVAQLQTHIAGLMADEKPTPTPPSPRRKVRWVGPVSDEIRRARQEAWSKRSRLALECGMDPRPKYFGVMHNLHPCLVSRWLTGQGRSIRPSSVQDQNMWRMVNEDITQFEAKNHGRVQIANSAPRFPRTMTA